MGSLYEDYYCKLPERAKNIFADFLVYSLEKKHEPKYDKLFNNLQGYAECKSPIETIFNIVFDEINIMNGLDFVLEKQFEITVKDGTHYVLDFAYITENIKLAIECDGHEFHEKTKEQVAYGNKRDYDLKMCDFDVLHFSGSEIYNDPLECAEKVVKYIVKKRKSNGKLSKTSQEDA